MTTGSTQVVLPILFILLVLRAFLPFVVEWYVNKKLDESPAYEGSIGNVDIHLYRGAYSIDDVTITKTDGEVPVPLFAAERVEFSALWSALLRGALVASITFERPSINIVDSDREENKQTGSEGKWLTLLDDLVPLRIDEIRVNDGDLHFRNFDVAQVVDVYITDLDAQAINLTNSRDLASSMVGRVSGAGQVVDAGRLEFAFSYDPDSEYPTFDFDGMVTDVPMLRLDDLITAYAPFDLEAGDLSLTSELTALNGEIKGYIKPLITGLKVFSWKGDVEEDQDNPLRLLWEGLVDLTSELFQNQPRDQLATLVEIDGRLDDPRTNKWETFVNILRNAFIQAFTLDYEDNGAVNLEERPRQGAGQQAAPEAGAAANTAETPATPPTTR
ncbi:MAG TPA: DUF748 domain-containing protein [Hyphomicrobiales bacterium]|nr:DUF748 domain-containing protein [Hyphomicrobiales bacterium]